MDDTELSKPVLLPIAWAVFIFGLILTAFTGKNYYEKKVLQENKGYHGASEQSVQVVNTINAEMQAEMLLVQNFADKLSSGEISYGKTETKIWEVLNQNSKILGLCVAYEPDVYQRDGENYAPYLVRNTEGLLDLRSITYEYTDPNVSSAQWYVKALEHNGGVWIGPYHGKASDDLIFSYSVPFMTPGSDDEIAGVVLVTQSVTNTFKRFTQDADLGFGGYLFLVNADDVIVYHPETGLIKKDLKEFSDRISGFSLEKVLASADTSTDTPLKGSISLSSVQGKSQKNTEDTAWFFVNELVTPHDWKAVVVINTMDGTYDPQWIISQLTNIYLALAVCLIGLGMVVFRVDKMSTPRLMAFSVMMGIIFLAGILWIWTIVYRYPELNHQRVLVNQVGVDDNLDNMYAAFDGVGMSRPRQIPTGILIENLTMTNQSVRISGYLWQKYPIDFPEEIKFPQLTDQVSGLVENEVYRYTRDNQQIVGWFFSTEIQQRFDNKLYPLDQAIIKIQIEPSKMGSDFVLVPSVLDYDYMNPGAGPGLDRNLKVRGWTIRNSFFTYDESNYGSTFGLFRQVPKDAIPNLVFNVRMNRNILSPIIAYCIVIYIVVMQVYGLSILRIDNPYQVMSIAAALFLVVAITHNGMRDAVVITGVVYLEYFFILLYLTILATTINAFMNAAKVPVLILTYRDNLLIKILFWPAFLGISLLFTLITFHPFFAHLLSSV